MEILLKRKKLLETENIYSTLMLLHNIVGLAPSELLQNPVLIVLRLIREVLVFVLNHTTVTEFLLWKQRLDFCFGPNRFIIKIIYKLLQNY